MENQDLSLNIEKTKRIQYLVKEVFKGLSKNQIKSEVYRLLLYLKTRNFQMFQNEIMRMLNTVEESSYKKELLKKWPSYIISDHDIKKAYSFCIGLLLIE